MTNEIVPLGLTSTPEYKEWYEKKYGKCHHRDCELMCGHCTCQCWAPQEYVRLMELEYC